MDGDAAFGGLHAARGVYSAAPVAPFHVGGTLRLSASRVLRPPHTRTLIQRKVLRYEPRARPVHLTLWIRPALE
jgi:hypothetical protein